MKPAAWTISAVETDLMLDIQGLSKRYPGATSAALNEVDLHVGPGQVLALIGPSGAGKSTLIRCINRLVEADAGSIVLDGLELTRLKAAALRKARSRIGMVFQEFALIDRLTVMENLLAGRLGQTGFWRSTLRRFPARDVEMAYHLLERVGLDGLHNRRADQLSGGQRQRVGIARALMQEPRLLLVDEPTASLDPRTSRQIMRLLLELCREQQLTAIINLHDVPLARAFCPRIIGLREGSVVFDGTPDELDETRMTEVYGEEDWQAAGANDAVDEP